jgi:hypothetical protein
LATATSKPESTKRVPGTPIKKVKTTHIHERPWQSAVAHKVGIDWDARKKKVPRISLPAAFPSTTKGGKVGPHPSSESEDEPEESPSSRKDHKGVQGLGIGRPSISVVPRHSWLTRRSSSGALSSGSETMTTMGTPSKDPGTCLCRSSLQTLPTNLVQYRASRFSTLPLPTDSAAAQPLGHHRLARYSRSILPSQQGSLLLNLRKVPDAMNHRRNLGGWSVILFK